MYFDELNIFNKSANVNVFPTVLRINCIAHQGNTNTVFNGDFESPIDIFEYIT